MRVNICAALLLLCMLLGGCVPAGGAAQDRVIVASFYPMYVFTQNIAKDVPGVRVVNLASENAGCLHDYQLLTRDMVTIEEADALVINGGGMEQFMDKVIAMRSDLPVINAGEGIEMLCGDDGHGHDHAHDHAQEALNAHVWLDVELAMKQVQNIADGLSAADSENAAAYQRNAEAYIARLAALDGEISAGLAPFEGSEIITFHEAFTYFADAYGLHVAGVISQNSGEEPSTRDIAKTCDLVLDLGVKALFVEPQYPTKSADTIARETGASVWTLDPVVSGDGSMESYESIMRENARVLTEALTK
ncbi:MAG: zinc ABC transporter substrate-binding protein [Clostridia bacterium]|nr:zinc ABC transporter substrate-binding protein [Clostridia bacterium]